MQFYLSLWLDSGCTLTLEKLGEWERDNQFEYESYMSAYVHRLEEIAKQRQRKK